MVGLPCSGKSTWIKQQPFNGVIVSFDDHITQNLDANYNKAWDKYQALNESQKTEIFLAINAKFEKAVKLNQNIIVDFTSLTVMDRKKWLDMTPSHYEKSAVILDNDLDVILRRNKERAEKTGKFIPVDVLDSMRGRYQEPCKDEGFDRVVFRSLKV
jgi:tRNA uridine 5-carbamoylmethylation protein Kti12